MSKRISYPKSNIYPSRQWTYLVPLYDIHNIETPIRCNLLQQELIPCPD